MAVAERNANSAISMIQVANGVYDEQADVLIRMRELAMQAANGDLTSTDRGYIDEEFGALRDEVVRQSVGATYNGVSLISGSAVTVDFQIGIDATSNDTLSVVFGSLSVAAFPTANVAGSDASNASAALGVIDDTLTVANTERASLGSHINRLEFAISNSQSMRTNLDTAQSHIRDADIAEETSQLARAQVLLEAGLSVLSSANQVSSLALSLLG